uniref:Uncharacterized protein n=1 Tax=Arundo donax TaxID=35708 RepID=A0A0A8Z4D8_ARUDO
MTRVCATVAPERQTETYGSLVMIFLISGCGSDFPHSVLQAPYPVKHFRILSAMRSILGRHFASTICMSKSPCNSILVPDSVECFPILSRHEKNPPDNKMRLE